MLPFLDTALSVRLKAWCSEQQGFGSEVVFDCVGVVLFLSCGVAVLVEELVMNGGINAVSCVIPYLVFTQLPATERNKNGNESPSLPKT